LTESSDPIPLRVLDRETALRPEQVPADLFEFLEMLGAPALIWVGGHDTTRTRVVSTLLHGNEPSGLHAVHHWLREGKVPAANVFFFIAAVRTALEPPALRKAKPESLIDIHNNTGHSPAYGVGPATGPAELELAALFSDRFVRNDLNLGTLVEATRYEFPSISIECGRAGDDIADENARIGLERYLMLDRFEESPVAKRPMTVYADPIRVQVREGVALAFGESRVMDADFTVATDIDRHNFELLTAGTSIGWLSPGVERPLVALGHRREDISDEFFEARDGVLETRRPLIPIMMTTNRRNALDDCLFYAVRREEPRG
jgi:hypothetical protein